jgi:hypothetical protein
MCVVAPFLLPFIYRYLHNLTLEDVGNKKDGKSIEKEVSSGDRLFTPSGSISHAELKIMNLKPGTGWEEVGFLPNSRNKILNFWLNFFIYVSPTHRNFKLTRKITEYKSIVWQLIRLELGARGRRTLTSRTLSGRAGVTCHQRESRKSFTSKLGKYCKTFFQLMNLSSR